jgi:NADH-quinone oxidoreductase subunit L
MEGPTPVSALIHAATMVTAGVYLVARSAVLFGLAPSSAAWVAGIGVATALFAATIAITQTDLKRILAYSTISQLGFMFLAIGVGGYVAGIFHLVTHAFFKALLFLGAGSVMHGLDGELDIRKMGNLRTKMPTTYWTFLIGAAALAGIPLLSGFFSKDEILWDAWLKSPILWIVGFITAILTAIYSFRMVFTVFWGKERDAKLYGHAHESPRVMTIPLVLLAIGSALVGYIGLPRLSLFGLWLEPVFVSAQNNAAKAAEALVHSPIEWVLLVGSGLVAIGGAYVAYRAYVVNTGIPERVRESLGGFAKLVEHKYYIDEAYYTIFVKPARDVAGWLAATFDKRVIDGVVNGIGGGFGWVGAQARKLQSGMVGLYALSIMVGAVALLIWLAIK